MFNESRQTWRGEFIDIAPDVATALGDATAVFNITNPILVLAVGVCIQSALGAGNLVVDFDRTIAAGGARGTADAGKVTVPASSIAGKICISRAVSIVCNPGDKITPEITGVSAAGSVFHFIEYVNQPESDANMTQGVIVSA